jgi:hypothetical protein
VRDTLATSGNQAVSVSRRCRLRQRSQGHTGSLRDRVLGTRKHALLQMQMLLIKGWVALQDLSRRQPGDPPPPPLRPPGLLLLLLLLAALAGAKPTD